MFPYPCSQFPHQGIWPPTYRIKSCTPVSLVALVGHQRFFLSFETLPTETEVRIRSVPHNRYALGIITIAPNNHRIEATQTKENEAFPVHYASQTVHDQLGRLSGLPAQQQGHVCANQYLTRLLFCDTQEHNKEPHRGRRGKRRRVVHAGETTVGLQQTPLYDGAAQK